MPNQDLDYQPAFGCEAFRKWAVKCAARLVGRGCLLGGRFGVSIENDLQVAPRYLQVGNSVHDLAHLFKGEGIDQQGFGLSHLLVYAVGQKADLLAAYLRFADRYYRKGGKVTSEIHAIHSAMRSVKRLYGRKPCSEFGPIAMQVVMQQMADDGLSRSTVNQHASRIKRMFKWGVSQELNPP